MKIELNETEVAVLSNGLRALNATGLKLEESSLVIQLFSKLNPPKQSEKLDSDEKTGK